MPFQKLKRRLTFLKSTVKTYKTHLSFSSDSSLGSEPPLSPATSSSSYHSESEDAQHSHSHARQSIQVVEPNSRAPVIVQLAPPPPPKPKKSPSSDVDRKAGFAPTDLEMNTMRLTRAELELRMIDGDADVYEDAEVLSISGVMLDKSRPKPTLNLEKPLPLPQGEAHAYASAEAPRFVLGPVVYVPPPPMASRQPSLLPHQKGVWFDHNMTIPSDAPSKAKRIFGFGTGSGKEEKEGALGVGKRHTIGSTFAKLRKARKSGAIDASLKSAPANTTTFGASLPLPPVPVLVNPPLTAYVHPLPPTRIAPATAPIPIPIPSSSARRPSYPDYDDYTPSSSYVDPTPSSFGDDVDGSGSADSGYGGMGYGSAGYHHYQGISGGGVSPRFTPPGSSCSNFGNGGTRSVDASPRTPGGSRKVPTLKRSFGSKGRTLSPGLMFELASEGYDGGRDENDARSVGMTADESEEGQFEDAVEDLEAGGGVRGLELEEFGVVPVVEEVDDRKIRSEAMKRLVSASIARHGGSRSLTDNNDLSTAASIVTCTPAPTSPSTSTFTARPGHYRHASIGASTMATVPLSPISLDIAGFPLEDGSVDDGVKSPVGTCSTIRVGRGGGMGSISLPSEPQASGSAFSMPPLSTTPSDHEESRPHPFSAAGTLRRTKSGAMSERSGTLSSISIGSSIGSSGADYSMPVPHLPPALRDSGVVVGPFGGIRDKEMGVVGDGDGDEVLTLEETMEYSRDAGRWEDESERVKVLEHADVVGAESRCVTPRPGTCDVEGGVQGVQTPTPSPTPDRVKLRLREQERVLKEKKEAERRERKAKKKAAMPVQERTTAIVLPIKERAIDLHLKQVEAEERMRIEEEEAKMRMRRGVHEKQQQQYGDPSSSSSHSSWAARSSMATSSECASITPSAHSSSSAAYRFPMFFPHAFASGALDDKVGKRPHTPTLASFSSPPPAWRSGNPASGSSLRFSAAMTMGSVKNAFAGVGAKVMGRSSSRLANQAQSPSTNVGDRDWDADSGSVYGYRVYSPSRNSSSRTTHSSVFGSMIIEGADDGGDFMDLRDPFASPVGNVSVGGSVNRVSSLIRDKGEGVVGGDSGMGDGGKDGSGCASTAMATATTRPARRMSAWGKLPMPMPLPVPPALPTSASMGSASSSGSPARITNSSPKAVGRRPTMNDKRRVRKERRAKKVASMRGASAALAASVGDKSGLPSSQRSNASSSSYSSTSSSSVKHGAEDVDFDFEEALLAQRLLKRLDSHGWDSRSELGC
ncbi:hypothetical protein CVT24_000034 [Panaeolus cyanescens]|uniref:Uncharacterized protein n=1 Tax=Panaeolus cyanescens TaxID=181874 RepID=A0A409W7E2_9AGAR|nr:hypothetical protein CVT24_000034 [Panaeolus cyanescens]